MSSTSHNPLPDKPPIGLYGGAILFAAPERWDEACFAAPALRALRAARPLSTIGVVCHEQQVHLWQSIGKIDAIITYDRRTKVSALRHALIESKKNWDAALLWESNLVSDLCRSMKLKQILCYQTKPLSRLATDLIPLPIVYGPATHRVQHYLNFLDALKIPYNKPHFFQPCQKRTQPERAQLTISPLSDFGPSHEWPADSWKQLLEKFRSEHEAEISLVVLPDRDLPRELKQLDCRIQPMEQWSDAWRIFPETTITVTADSSFAHLSAHVGAPTLTLFGPNDPDWKRPLGKQNRVIRRKVECSPCLSNKCALDLRCQKELAVEHVYDALVRMWQER
jgi:ADP-heptose:LPS heptosyltransferase